MNNIIGRHQQIEELMQLYNSKKAEFVAIYGRRRVGKTFLVGETLKGLITFNHAGLSPVDEENDAKQVINEEIDIKRAKVTLKMQLEHFYLSLKLHGYSGRKKPKSWLEAFFMLEQLLIAIDNGKRQVVFLDELPWMDTPRSSFLVAFEAFWNTWACHRNILLVVCGSANSWILDNLINNKGGLYGRTTYQIKLSPFTLGECKQFYALRDIPMSDYDIVQSYMILGGIPYYMNYVKREFSLAQNIDNLFWSSNAILKSEFNRLFRAAFKSPQDVRNIVIFLAKRHRGFTRKEIVEGANQPDGTDLSERLNALVESDFVTKYVPFGYSKREIHYKLSDPFCIFYIHFVLDKIESSGFWSSNFNSPQISSWRGIAFEEVCLNHVEQIKHALSIGGVASEQSAWALQGEGNTQGTQIDLLIIRKDNMVNMCEMKYYSDEFEVDKEYDHKLRHRLTILSDKLPKKYGIHPTIITTFGMKKNMYSGFFVRELTMECLFNDANF